LTRDQHDKGCIRRPGCYLGSSSGTLGAMLEAARGLPDLLKARREAMEARWRGENGGPSIRKPVLDADCCFGIPLS
jgi:hypothetical protein